MTDKKNPSRQELINKLHAKIGEKKIGRGSKKQKEHVLEKTLNAFGLDKNKFKADIEAIKKQGGFTLDMNQ